MALIIHDHIPNLINSAFVSHNRNNTRYQLDSKPTQLRTGQMLNISPTFKVHTRQPKIQ